MKTALVRKDGKPSTAGRAGARLRAALRVGVALIPALATVAVVAVPIALYRAAAPPAVSTTSAALGFALSPPPATAPSRTSAGATTAKVYGPEPATAAAPPPPASPEKTVVASVTPAATTEASATRTGESNWCDSFCGEAPTLLGCPEIANETVDTATLACLDAQGDENGTAYLAWHRPGMPYTNPPARP